LSRSKLEVADIFRAHGSTWRAANAGHVSLDQLKVMSAIERCRTAALTLTLVAIFGSVGLMLNRHLRDARRKGTNPELPEVLRPNAMRKRIVNVLAKHCLLVS
jgi:hypothetical protein